MTLQEQIDFFFAPPLPKQTGPEASTLHLLRQELQDCWIGAVIPEGDIASDKRQHHRVFATTMIIVAGVDLLAKFYAGSDAIGEVTTRFKKFAEDFVFKGSAEPATLADVLYVGCRNPILHSFTLHQTRYTMTLVDRLPRGAIWRDKGDPNHFIVNVLGLIVAFLASVTAYEAAVRADANLQQNFAAMFPTYGSIPQFVAFLNRVGG